MINMSSSRLESSSETGHRKRDQEEPEEAPENDTNESAGSDTGSGGQAALIRDRASASSSTKKTQGMIEKPNVIFKN